MASFHSPDHRSRESKGTIRALRDRAEQPDDAVGGSRSFSSLVAFKRDPLPKPWALKVPSTPSSHK